MNLAIGSKSREQTTRNLTVTELTPDMLDAIEKDWDGAPSEWPRKKAAISQAMKKNGFVFLVTWTGPKNPTGVEILGQEVMGLAQGRVEGSYRTQLGSYIRITRHHGQDGNEHQVVICADPTARNNVTLDDILTRSYM